MSEREGPQRVTAWTCYGCRWYEWGPSNSIWYDGDAGWCHANGGEFESEEMPDDGETPPWCPLLPKEPQP